MESLMFDAQATRTLGDYWIATQDKHRDLYDLYGITTSFVSTRAGLTRWKELSRDTATEPYFTPLMATTYSTDVAYPDEVINQTFIPPSRNVYENFKILMMKAITIIHSLQICFYH